jgi:hypothetical protein
VARPLPAVLLLVLVAVAGAVFALDPFGWRTPGAGLVVDVRVLDADGKPVPRAQVQARYAPGWKATGPTGGVRLEGVLLRAEEVPTSATVGAAVDVRAPFFAMRRGSEPEVVRGEDGSWEATYRLTAHGVVRIHVEGSYLPNARATLEPDPVLQRWEAMDGRSVARPGEPAAFRVYPELDACWATMVGDEGVASQRARIETPSPGHVVEHTFTPGRAFPIRGRVTADGDAEVPSLVGVLDVLDLSDAVAPVPEAPVRIAADGTFEVPYAGKGPYRLRARCLLLEPTEPVALDGGGEAALRGKPRPRVDVLLPDLPLSGPAPSISVTRGALGPDDEGDPYVRTSWGAAVPADGAVGTLLVRVPGTDATPPRVHASSIEVPVRGAVSHRAVLADAPHGDVRLRVEAAGGAVVGGTVSIGGGRSRTLLPGLATEVRFPHVDAGPVTARVAWTDGSLATEFVEGDVAAGATLDLVARPVPGGRVEVRGGGAGVARDARPRVLAWRAGASPYGRAAGSVVLKRVVGAARWTTLESLRPGPYEATLAPEGGQGVAVRFEVRAGETTAIPLEIP